jgi:hypothetical protein
VRDGSDEFHWCYGLSQSDVDTDGNNAKWGELRRRARVEGGSMRSLIVLMLIGAISVVGCETGRQATVAQSPPERYESSVDAPVTSSGQIVDEPPEQSSKLEDILLAPLQLAGIIVAAPVAIVLAIPLGIILTIALRESR